MNGETCEKNSLRRDYGSPRWSTEITDCSMPMTFDTYSRCSYGCAYCFSVYQRDIGRTKFKFRNETRSVNPQKIKKLFMDPDSSQFGLYIRAKKPFQWGGLSDQFDEYERKHEITLELLRFFQELQYPICFSTKSSWWVNDLRYRQAFEGSPWNVKFSIITLDNEASRKIEAGCPTPLKRLEAMKAASRFCNGGVTLRLRPFIIGLSEKTLKELISRAADAGATAVSTEFFCLEQRNPTGLTKNFPLLSDVIGFDILSYYRRYSYGTGYLRLCRDAKRPYVEQIEQLCRDNGMRFYVSDAHFKERSQNGSCCGLPETWNYTRGQYCEALMIAKRIGKVYWSDIEPDTRLYSGFLWDKASGYNCRNCESRAKFNKYSMQDYLRWTWNHPNSGQSPYKMFEGIIRPEGIDENGDLVYIWDESKA